MLFNKNFENKFIKKIINILQISAFEFQGIKNYRKVLLPKLSKKYRKKINEKYRYPKKS